MRRLLIGTGVVAVAAGTAACVFAVRDALYRRHALPGVRVQRIAPERPVTIVAAGRRFRVLPGAVLRYDSAATRQDELAANRGSFWHRAGSLLSPVGWRRDVPADYTLRRRALGSLFEQLDRLGRSSVDARVTLHGLTPVVSPGRPGSRVLRNEIVAALLAGERRIVARYRPTAPSITTPIAQAAAAKARRVLAGPVALTYHGAFLGSLPTKRLARVLRLTPQPALDERPLAKLLQPYVQRWRRRAANARLVVDGKLVRVAPSRAGHELDVAAAAARLLAATRVLEVPMHDVPADLTTAEAKALGVRRELVSFTTDMGPSSSNRVHNVHLMADFIDGTLVKPGQVFSFNGVVGPRTAARGFREGQMIIGSLVLPAIGGGVCQTATTLFNDVFEAGLPVLERHNHNLYISHYPLGRDATVSWGGPDFKFRNDLEHAILIKSSYTNATLTFTFYGTPQGRRIAATTGPKVDWRGPSMNYAIDPSRPAGSVRVVHGSGQMGFDVSVHRTVYQSGKVLRKDTFVSTYIPDSPTTVYGPGAHPPGPYIVLPSQT
ncbi:MAG TPA: VanW family protein [Gaiellaceae bacterium]